MIATQIARLIADISLVLNLHDDEVLDADDAVQALEVLGANIQALDKAFLRELIDAFAIIAPEYGKEAEKSVRNIPYYCSLEEVLAADDPVRLAELEARPDPDED